VEPRVVSLYMQSEEGNLLTTWHPKLIWHEVLCDLTGNVALQNLLIDRFEAAFEIWRQQIVPQFALLAESRYKQRDSFRTGKRSE
jgi:hypothetical protein